MTEEFIKEQSPTELRCGNWAVGRYAFKLENVRPLAPIPATGKQGLWKFDQEAAGFDSLHLEPWNPADFGKVQHKAEADGQLNLLEFDSNEPPEPDDYPGDLEAFKKAYLAWAELQEGTAEEYQHITPEEIWNQSDNGNGSIFVQASVLASPTPGLNVGDDRPISSANKMNIADESLTSDSPADQSPQTLSEVIGDSTMQQISLPQALPASPSAMTEIDSLPKTIETVSPQSLPPSINCNPNLQSSKTLPACSTAQNDSSKLYFAGILNELSESGYDVEWQTISSAHFGAPWRRERLLVIAIARSSIGQLEPAATWEEQTRNAIDSIRTDNQFGSCEPGIPRSWLQSPSGLDESTGESDGTRIGASPGAAVAERPQFGVASRDGSNRDRRSALGNALHWPVAAVGLKRIEYLAGLTGLG
jgi:hypothetical protein